MNLLKIIYFHCGERNENMIDNCSCTHNLTAIINHVFLTDAVVDICVLLCKALSIVLIYLCLIADCRAISMGQGQEIHARKLVGQFMQTVSIWSIVVTFIFSQYSCFRLRPPLLSDQFSTKVSQSNHILNLLRATTCHKRPWQLLELKVWKFLLFVASRKATTWQITERILANKMLYIIAFWVVQETKISLWEVLDFFSKLTFHRSKTCKMRVNFL